MERTKWLGLMVAVSLLMPTTGHARLQVGYRVKALKVKDASNNPAMMPDIGKKVVTIFYTDPDVKDQNEPFRDLLKASKLDKTYYRGMGVVNMKDTWKPNFAIRSVVRKKVAKFKSLILTDTDHTLKNTWGLGNCDEKDVVIVVGPDSRVKLLKMGKMSPAEMKSGLALVQKLVADHKAGKK